jgi:hypothetical protein
MSDLFALLDKFDRSKFPDLEAAKNAISLDHLITPGRPSAKIAQEEQEKLETQRVTDFCNFHLSLGHATKVGGENACADKHQFESIDDQFGKWQQANIPQTHQRHPSRSYPAAKKLPKPKPSAPGGIAPTSLTKTKVNRGATSGKPQNYYVPTLKPTLNKGKQERQADRFIKAQAGARGTTVGDAGVVFGANGQPYPGDSYLDRSIQQNESANLASSTPPILEPPKTVIPKAVGGGGMKRADNGQLAPQSDTVGNMAAIAGIALIVTGIMFALQYVISTVAFVMNIQSLLTTCNNIAASFSAVFNTIGSLLGLGEDVSKPLDDTISGMLNSVFGKEKVDYVKYQWAKVSSALSAAGNVLNGLRGVSNTLGSAIEVGANSTGRIGNALRSMGFLDRTVGAFDEKVSAKVQNSKLNATNTALQTADSASNSLQQAIADTKSGREELEQIDKEYAEKQEESEKAKSEADKKYGAEPTPPTPNFKPGDY